MADYIPSPNRMIWLTKKAIADITQTVGKAADAILGGKVNVE